MTSFPGKEAYRCRYWSLYSYGRTNIASMKKFLDENFLLSTKTSERLFHDYARDLPIIDYHCHLRPDHIAADHRFENLGRAWLDGDHYKWRAMRANGVPEEYCTGNRSDWEKFEKWAHTVPFTIRNPLYHWTHLELQRYFDLHELLDPSSAKKIYDDCSRKLQATEYSVTGLLKKMKVQVVCTTDDPVDSLEWHKSIAAHPNGLQVFPTFRPDRAMDLADPGRFCDYIEKLQSATNTTITN